MAEPSKDSGNDKPESSASALDELPLPPSWTKGFSNSQQKTYYCHPASKHTQWHFPTATEAQDPRLAKKRLQQATSTSPNGPSNATANANATANPTGVSSDGQKNNTPKSQQRQLNSTSSSTSALLGDIVGSAPIRVDQYAGQPKKRPRIGSSTSANKSSTIAGNKATATASDSDAACVAIIVPYRDIHTAQNRARHLQQFVPHMHAFLQKQLGKGTLIDYHIYIIEQSNDDRKFNRGKLLNIGFDIARKNKCRAHAPKHDIFIFHDVDLLPGDDLGASYTKFPSVPLHIARVWDRYSNNPKYFGGIVSFSESDMKRINGYPSTFWGWGGEDDEMQKRCEKLGIRWDSPSRGSIRDLEEMSLKEKLSFLKNNRNWKCMVKWEALEEHEKTWRENGLASLKYSVLQMEDLDRNRNTNSNSSTKSRATKITVDVKLNGNHWSNERCGMDYVWSG
eukprot:scaffold1133_cov294-Chaetoceros_neogracile.AAC.6